MSCHAGHDGNNAWSPNYGRKTILGPDRHQQRKREKLDQSQTAALKAQQDKGAESESKGHSTRLDQRKRALVVVEKDRKDAQHNQAKLIEQACAIGPPQERADRDFRKQTIMTIRTLLLENALIAFMVALCEHLPKQVSLDCILGHI